MADKKIVFATGNTGKMREIREILAETGHITEILVETRNTGFHVAHLRTDHDNIYEVLDNQHKNVVEYIDWEKVFE